MKKKSFVSLMLVAALLFTSFTGCGKNNAGGTGANNGAQATSQEEASADQLAREEVQKSKDITIVYTNDVHSYIDNVVKDDEGNITGDGLRFSKVAAMVQDLRSEGQNVILVDAGDEIQGSVYGAMDEGLTIIDIMGATGYQVATPGNHEFDYGVLSFLKLAENASFSYITCNLHQTTSDESIFKVSKMFDIAGKKIAFIGITTPETITSSTPTYFQDETGKFIYVIDGMKDNKELFESVQKAVDSVKEEADYVIALGHIGTGLDEVKAGISSEDIIKNVSGLNAFIDGHSHTTMEHEIIADKDGKDVVLTQTGSYLNAVGVMTITEDGQINTKLVNEYDREDEKVAALEKEWMDDVANQMNEKIGVLENKLYTNNPDNDNQRLIRAQELNLGDFNADSIYWFFNKQLELECDVAIQNGGGIRNQIEKGDITYLSAKSVNPFGNMICLISATGQQIVDALEMGSSEIGIWDEEWDAPAENGGFLQVAGLSYTIDASIPCSVQTDENGLFKSVDGDYRVKDVKVYNRETGEYDPIELDKKYQLGGINYILRNDGNGLSMFDDDNLTIDYVGQDYIILAEYIKSFAEEGGFPTINTKNSPLSDYEGYLIDYENPYGAGRITIENIVRE